MISLLDVPRFDIWYLPYIGGVLSKRVATPLSFFRAFVMALSGVLLGNTSSIKIEFVAVSLCEPENSFMAAAESTFRMDAVAKSPNYPIP